MAISPLSGLAARLPGLEGAVRLAQSAQGYGWEPAKVDLDKWQLFRLATPFAEELEHEADMFEPGHDYTAGDEELSISVEGAMNALGAVLPGLRERPEVLELLVRRVLVMVADGGNSPERKRVTLSCWLNTVFALRVSSRDSPARYSIWWRLCGT